jgi:hypothetical protein
MTLAIGIAPVNATSGSTTKGPDGEAQPSYVRISYSHDTYERIDTEVAKLGLRGITVVAASGDNGPFGYGIPNPFAVGPGRCCSPRHPTLFEPSFLDTNRILRWGLADVDRFIIQRTLKPRFLT